MGNHYNCLNKALQMSPTIFDLDLHYALEPFSYCGLSFRLLQFDLCVLFAFISVKLAAIYSKTHQSTINIVKSFKMNLKHF